VNTGVLDQGQVQAGHIASPGMLQPLLVSVDDEEQVECTYLLENTDIQTSRQMDESRHFITTTATTTFTFTFTIIILVIIIIIIRQREKDKSRQERKGCKQVGHTYFLESTDGQTISEKKNHLIPTYSLLTPKIRGIRWNKME